MLAESDDFDQTETYMLHEISTLLEKRAYSISLAKRGLTYSEFIIALSVQQMGNPSQVDVGSRLGFSASLVSQRVKSLCGKEIIVQRQDDSSRRVVRLGMTSNGARVIADVCRELEEHSSRAIDVLGSDRELFRKSLRKLRDALRSAD